MSQQLGINIKEVSIRGVVTSEIDCPAGHIAVFRAQSFSELEPLCRALAGVGGAEHFRIEIFGKEYNPEQSLLIGFGERLPPDAIVAGLFPSQGLSGDALGSYLEGYGLTDVIGKKVSDLSPCETRRLQIIIATQSVSKVIVINEPFEPIASVWREKIAALLLKDAKGNRRIIIVPRLSYRPECWIDNPTVIRLQVGGNLQRTIGFAGGSDGINNIIKELRTNLKQEVTAQKAGERSGGDGTKLIPTAFGLSQALLQPIVLEKKPSLSPIRLGIVALAALCLIMISAVYLKKQRHMESMEAVIATGNEVVVPTEVPVSSVVLEALPTPTPIQKVIDIYPVEIREAVLVAFKAVTEPDAISKTYNGPSQEEVARTSNSLFAALLAANETGDKSANTYIEQPPIANESGVLSTNEASFAERQEMIRQRFLDAISKASQNSKLSARE